MLSAFRRKGRFIAEVEAELTGPPDVSSRANRGRRRASAALTGGLIVE
jgi:hypothetical protein